MATVLKQYTAVPNNVHGAYSYSQRKLDQYNKQNIMHSYELNIFLEKIVCSIIQSQCKDHLGYKLFSFTFGIQVISAKNRPAPCLLIVLSYTETRSPFYEHSLTTTRTWISNYIHVLCGIIHAGLANLPYYVKGPLPLVAIYWRRKIGRTFH